MSLLWSTFEPPGGTLRTCLRKLRETSVNLKNNKCEFAVRETEYLGHVVNVETTIIARGQNLSYLGMAKANYAETHPTISRICWLL